MNTINTAAYMRECKLCPRQCGIDRTKSPGACSCGDRVIVSKFSLHYWEEPCISGQAGSGTVFFSGCPLKCVYCQNHRIALAVRGRETTVRELGHMFLSLQEQGAHNINLVTGVHFVPQIIEALNQVKHRLTIPIVYNSGGYELPETLKLLEGYVDIYLPDFKYFSPDTAAKYSRAPDYPERARKALDEMVRQAGAPVFGPDGMMQRGVIVRHLCLPGHKNESKDVLEYLHGRYGDEIYVSVMNQYTPVYEGTEFSNLHRRLTRREYEEILDFCNVLGMNKVFIQTGETALESFIPDF